MCIVKTRESYVRVACPKSARSPGEERSKDEARPSERRICKDGFRGYVSGASDFEKKIKSKK